MDDKEDRLTINVRKSRVNITLGLTIVALIGLMGLTGVIMATYYNDRDSTPTVMNKNLDAGDNVSPDEQLDEAPEYNVTAEKVINGTNVVAVHSALPGGGELVMLNDILYNSYKPRGNFIIYYFKDKAAAENYIKDKKDDELLSAGGTNPAYTGVMKYNLTGEKALYINENGSMKKLNEFK
jgi:hypothetical protein